MVNKQNLIAKFDARFQVSRIKFPDREYGKLIDFLGSTSFFEDPAAKGHHNNFPGGLAQHVLNFTFALETLMTSFEGIVKFSDDQFDPFLVAIGHDMNKIGFYTITDFNKKIGDKWHNLKQYGYKNSRDMLSANSISLSMMNGQIELTQAERLSIYWAEGPWSTYNQQNLDKAWKNAIGYDHRVYLTHTADMITSQMMESTLNEVEVDKAIREWHKL